MYKDSNVKVQARHSLPLSLHHWFSVQTWRWEASSCFCWTGPSGGWVSSWSPPDASEWWSFGGAWSQHLLRRSSRRPRSLLPAGWSCTLNIYMLINAEYSLTFCFMGAIFMCNCSEFSDFNTKYHVHVVKWQRRSWKRRTNNC